MTRRWKNGENIYTLSSSHSLCLDFCSPLLNVFSCPPPLPQPGHGHHGLVEDHDSCDPDRLRAGSLPARAAGGVDGAARLPLEVAGNIWMYVVSLVSKASFIIRRTPNIYNNLKKNMTILIIIIKVFSEKILPVSFFALRVKAPPGG